MVSDVAGVRQFGEGPLARAAALVYTVLVVELLLLLTTAPGLVVLVLLDHDASNAPLAAVCALPFGPALSAALFALHRRRLDLADLKPGAAFWRGYRLNALGALKVWVPLLVLLTVIAVNLSHRSAAGVPAWWSVLLVIVAVAVTLASANALVITSLYVFRAGDTARLSAYFLIRRPTVTLGNAGLLLLAGTVTVLWSEAVLMLVAALFAAGLLATSRPMLAEIQEKFVA